MFIEIIIIYIHNNTFTTTTTIIIIIIIITQSIMSKSVYYTHKRIFSYSMFRPKKVIVSLYIYLFIYL